MIIILGLNNVLFYSRVRGTTMASTMSTSFGYAMNWARSVCVCEEENDDTFCNLFGIHSDDA